MACSSSVALCLPGTPGNDPRLPSVISTTNGYAPNGQRRRNRTVLDDVPTPTDQKVAGSSARDMREMSEAPVIKAVTSAEVRRSAHEPARAAYPVVRKQRHANRIPPS
jgi:hypothetical protein